MQTRGERLRRAREMAGFESAEDFALALKVHPHSYRNYERGTRAVPRHLVPKFAKALGVTQAWLETGEAGDFLADLPIEDQQVAIEAARVALSIPKTLRSIWIRQGEVLKPALPPEENNHTDR
jgi:transcriptional regulator with XRE-family HTH domain